MMAKVCSNVLLTLSLLLAAACGDKAQEAAPAPVAPAAPAAAPAAPAAPANAPTPAPQAAATDRVEDPTFELALEPTGTYAAGKPASFGVSLKPRGEYHVNQEYPFSVSLSSAGVSFPKAELGKPDAAQFDDNAVQLDVPFTASAAGKHTVTAHVKFAVCTPETCVPDERTLALALAVE